MSTASPTFHGVSCIVAQNGCIVFEKRAEECDGAGLLDFCSGHIEPNETPDQCMYRELEEELGIIAGRDYRGIFQLGKNIPILLPTHMEKCWLTDFYFLPLTSSVRIRPNRNEIDHIVRIPFHQAILHLQTSPEQFRSPITESLEPILKQAGTYYGRYCCRSPFATHPCAD